MEEKELRENWYFLHRNPCRILIDENIWELAFQLPIEEIVADLQRYARGEA
jgi:hypothetical protein